ncbi:LuxR C-terminal-related transcriptional regulator [Caldimonas sp. KR1-144]|uniref:LuxR C-terminal-related transcriptional regulator n=1 Tax=Caldimonas sp. KR1-144 TaxID=3400911 RepID=UPI003C0E75A3
MEQLLRFAATKIQPPRVRAKRLARPQLDAAIDEALPASRVLLLQAPAGFGKTSTLAALVERHAARSAWISLDEDDDAERLFACLVAALEPHDLPWRSAPDALTRLAGGDAAERRRALDELIDALAAAGDAPGLIALDDLHRVTRPDALALLDALILGLPLGWTLVIGTRTPPALALARLRASGELAEFGQEALRFSPDEARALLDAEALPQPDERARDLFERTAGWPAGLRLALAALRTRRGAVGGAQLIDRHLFDYLCAEVLDDLPAPLHDFLLRCAVLPELTERRAAAVSGDARAPEWMDEIERRGLFATALDAQERTLVLHDLFRDALQARARLHLPGELPELLRRAAQEEGDALRKVGFLLRAEDWRAAEGALAEAAPELFLQGGAGEVLRLVEQFPQAQRSAQLARLAGAASVVRSQWVDAVRWFEAAIVAGRAANQHAEVLLVQAYLANALYPVDRNAEAEQLIARLREMPDLGNSARVLMLLADASQHFRRGEHLALPAIYGELIARLEDESLLRWWECALPINISTIAGMPPVIERYVAGAQRRLGDRPLPMRGELRLLRAFGLLWRARFDEAMAELRVAEDDMKWLAVSGEMQIGVELFRNLFDAMHGRADAVRQRLERLLLIEEHAPPARRLLWRHQIAVYGVRLSDTLGLGPEALRRWAAELKENPIEDAVTARNPRAVAVRARYACAQGRWAEACAQFALILPKLHEMDVMGQRSDLTLRAGHALLRDQRLSEAAAVIAPVLDRLIAEGVRAQALLCGPVVLRTLADARWGSLLSADQRAELQAAAQLAESLHGARPVETRLDDEPLTARERAVLERIAAGDSNKLIARALDISPHTVKRHVANILEKLGLSSRGQASAWLRERG